MLTARPSAESRSGRATPKRRMRSMFVPCGVRLSSASGGAVRAMAMAATIAATIDS